MIKHFGAASDRPLSQAVRAGGWVFVSGQASTDHETGAFVPGTFEQEYQRSVANLSRALNEAGACLADVVKVTAYVRHEANLARYNELYLGTFAHPRPARTTVAMGFDFLHVELDAVAYVGDSQQEGASS